MAGREHYVVVQDDEHTPRFFLLGDRVDAVVKKVDYSHKATVSQV